jgi:SpoIID/LytB domain protein
MRLFLTLLILPLTALTLCAQDVPETQDEQDAPQVLSTYQPQETDDTQHRLNAAAQLYFSHKPHEALNEYVTLAKETGNRTALLNAAFIALEQNELALATEMSELGYNNYPNDDEILDMAIEVALATGDYVNAEQWLALVMVQPSNAGFYYLNLARAQLGTGQREQAKENLQKAADKGAPIGIVQYLLGMMYEKDNDFKHAEEAFGKALENDHQFIDARKHYAGALDKNKKYRDAYRQYRIVVAASKQDDGTRKKMERVKGLMPASKKEKKQTEQQEDIEETDLSFVLQENKAPAITSIKSVEVPEGFESQEIKIGLGVQKNGKPSYRTSVKFMVSGDFQLIGPKGEVIIANGKPNTKWEAKISGKKSVLVTPKGNIVPFSSYITMVPKPNNSKRATTFILKNVVSGAGMTWASVSDKVYRGKLQIRYNPHNNSLVPINILNVEEYLLGVISSEMPVQFPDEALRAQAVLARTYALKLKGKHKHYGYDLCDMQNCQVYGGVRAEHSRANAAVLSTWGETLQYNNKPIEGVFSANSGGLTQDAAHAGWSNTPYLTSVSDYLDFDVTDLQPYQLKKLLQHSPLSYGQYGRKRDPSAFRWALVVSADDLRQIIKRHRKGKDIGEVTAVIPTARSKSGYVSKVVVKGTQGQVTLGKENLIRAYLSPGLLRSNFFIAEPYFEDGKLAYFIFYGGGWGHGVGFDQTGAAGRAADGQDYKTILKHYFPLTELVAPKKKK